MLEPDWLLLAIVDFDLLFCGPCEAWGRRWRVEGVLYMCIEYREVGPGPNTPQPAHIAVGIAWRKHCAVFAMRSSVSKLVNTELVSSSLFFYMRHHHGYYYYCCLFWMKTDGKIVESGERTPASTTPANTTAAAAQQPLIAT